MLGKKKLLAPSQKIQKNTTLSPKKNFETPQVTVKIPVERGGSNFFFSTKNIVELTYTVYESMSAFCRVSKAYTRIFLATVEGICLFLAGICRIPAYTLDYSSGFRFIPSMSSSFELMLLLRLHLNYVSNLLQLIIS